MKHTLTVLIVISLCLFGIQGAHAKNTIIHDGEFEFFSQQHGEKWDAEDKEIDQMLADKEAELLEI